MTVRGCGSALSHLSGNKRREGGAPRSILFRLAVGGPGAHRIEEPLRDWRVGVNAAVAKKGPVAARVLEQRKIDFSDDELLFFVRGLGDDAAEGIGQEAAAPEFE